MMHNRNMLIGVATAFLIAMTALGADPDKLDTRDQIKAKIAEVNAAVIGGKSPPEVTELLYAPDMIAIGEGEPEATRGIKAMTAGIEASWAASGPDGQKKCVLSLTDDAGVASADTYASFVTLHCEPNPPAVKEAMDIRAIYVWKRLPQGWRVVLEQWGVGKL